MADPTAPTDWRVLSRRAAFASHRLIGWIYWDPVGIRKYADLGIPDGMGYYITTRAGALVDAGADVVTGAYYSIHPDFIRVSIDLLSQHATTADAVRVRDEAVVEGLQHYVPDICDDLAALAEPLWEAADSLPNSGRVMYAAMRGHRRTDDPLLSAWLGRQLHSRVARRHALGDPDRRRPDRWRSGHPRWRMAELRRRLAAEESRRR